MKLFYIYFNKGQGWFSEQKHGFGMINNLNHIVYKNWKNKVYITNQEQINLEIGSWDSSSKYNLGFIRIYYEK